MRMLPISLSVGTRGRARGFRTALDILVEKFTLQQVTKLHIHFGISQSHVAVLQRFLESFCVILGHQNRELALVSLPWSQFIGWAYTVCAKGKPEIVLKGFFLLGI
jgi:hypothetical protein